MINFVPNRFTISLLATHCIMDSFYLSLLSTLTINLLSLSKTKITADCLNEQLIFIYTLFKDTIFLIMDYPGDHCQPNSHETAMKQP